MFDVLITGGTVVDGTGKPGVASDVGITDGKIVAVGNLSDASAGRSIDAAGLTVAPGFIDTHAHSDGALLLDPQHANGLRQGITTEILGQDGLSYAPLSHEDYLMYRQYLSGVYGLPPEDIETGSVDAFLGNYHNRLDEDGKKRLAAETIHIGDFYGVVTLMVEAARAWKGSGATSLTRYKNELLERADAGLHRLANDGLAGG